MSAIGLAALGLAALFALIVVIAFPDVGKQVLAIVQGTFLLLLGLTLVALLLIAVTGFDPTPLLREIGVMMAGNRVVDFHEVLPDQYRVEEVIYQDTDGDGAKEWVVLYQFDLADGRSPYAGAVYDYDRGTPPAVFPYRLVPPDRDYLSEAAVLLEREDVVKVGEVQPVEELFVYGEIKAQKEYGGRLRTDLTIFRHVPNTFSWEAPRDEPRRYQVIGAFRGDGGVEFDRETKTVTVRNRAGYDRSQLAVETVYGLDEGRGSYMSAVNPEQLGAPLSSQVIFAFGMPSDILDTPYPEKIVLGFYKVLAERPNDIKPEDFLTGEALIRYNQNQLDYFGFGGTSGKVERVRVTQLGYAPEVEEFNPSVSVLGQDPRFLVVDVAFEARVGKTDTRTPAPVQLVTTLVNGKWKIDRRL